MMHFTGCPLCRQGTLRHNKVLYEFDRCLPKIGISTTLNPHDYPMPKSPEAIANTQTRFWLDKSCNGPDIQVHTDGHCIDFTVVSPIADWELRDGVLNCRNCFTRAESRKKDHYEQWCKVYNMECKSLVMSTTGFLAKASVKLLEDYGKNRAPWFARWCMLRMQHALAEAQAQIFHKATARAAGAAFLAPKTNSKPKPKSSSNTQSNLSVTQKPASSVSASQS
jgi:hypothetical protein